MWLPIVAANVRCTTKRVHQRIAHRESNVRYLLLQLGALVVVLTVVVVLSNQRTCERWDGSKKLKYFNRTLLAFADQREANDSERTRQSVRSSFSVIGLQTEKLLSKAGTRLQRIFNDVWRDLLDESVLISSRRLRNRPQWHRRRKIVNFRGGGSKTSLPEKFALKN